MTTPPSLPSQLLRVDARGVADAGREVRAEGDAGVSVVVECGGVSGRVVAVGTASEVDAHEAARSPALRTVRRPGCVLIPGMVNAHTHLDLTHIGPRPLDPDGGFVPWIEMIRQNRQGTPQEIASSVAKGAELSLRAGVVAVGDIAGAVGGRASLAGYEALVTTPLRGVSFMEFFALGRGEQRGLAALAEAVAEAERRGIFNLSRGGLRFGIQPHAPYSVSPVAYFAVHAMLGDRGPMCTHVAESIEERLFIESGSGPLRRMLEEFGLWNEDLDYLFGFGLSPVDHVAECALGKVGLLVHVNDAGDEDLDRIAAAGSAIAYCPRASAYFGAARHFGTHRYREMLARGINVALGTDSIVNLPPDAASRGISILDEMRFLHRRDGMDAATLLKMGTVNGAKALGLDANTFQIRPSVTLAGLVGVPVERADTASESLAAAVLRSDALPEPLFHSNPERGARD